MATHAHGWIVANSDPTMRVTMLDDRLVADIGHRADSTYAETFWLPTIGPSALWALRRMSVWLRAEPDPDGLNVSLPELGRLIGLGAGSGHRSLIVNTLSRLCDFGICRAGPGSFGVHLLLAPLTVRQMARLPECLRPADVGA